MPSFLNNSPLPIIIALALFVAASGCGYQLQQPLLHNDAVQASLQPVFIDARTSWSVPLQRELTANQVKVTTQRKNAASIISLAETQRYNRGLSVSADGRDAEFLHGINASLSWSSGRQMLIESAPIQVEQTQLANPSRRAAQQRESELIDEDLIHALVMQVLQHLRYSHPGDMHNAGN